MTSSNKSNYGQTSGMPGKTTVVTTTHKSNPKKLNTKSGGCSCGKKISTKKM